MLVLRIESCILSSWLVSLACLIATNPGGCLSNSAFKSFHMEERLNECGYGRTFERVYLFTKYLLLKRLDSGQAFMSSLPSSTKPCSCSCGGLVAHRWGHVAAIRKAERLDPLHTAAVLAGTFEPLVSREVCSATCRI